MHVMKAAKDKRIKKETRIKKNKKGFTLIEVLAVIVIIGILGTLVVPNISNYIDYSKRETYRNSINEFGRYIKLKYSNDYASGQLITVHSIPEQELKSNIKSPFGQIDASNTYAVVLCNNVECNTYIQVVDDKGYGINLTNINEINNLNKDKIDKVKYPVSNAQINNYTIGDANMSGEIDIMDPTVVMMVLNNSLELSSIKKYFGDVNSNGKIDYCDAKAIQLYLGGYDVSFPLKQGDINKDGKINEEDLQQLQNNIDNGTQLNSNTKLFSDLNCDENVDETDTNILKNYLDGKIKVLPEVN